jgi:hypothetical protein
LILQGDIKTTDKTYRKLGERKREARPLLHPKPYKRIPPLIHQSPTLIYIFKQKNPRNQKLWKSRGGKEEEGTDA